MINKIELLFPPGQSEDGPVGVFYGLCRFAVGDKAELTYKGVTFRQTLVITKRLTKELLDITPKDYKAFGKYKTPKAFWIALENAYKTGIPGDAKVTFVYFKEHGTEEVVTLPIEQVAVEEAPQTPTDEPELEITGLEQTVERELLEGYPAELEPAAGEEEPKKRRKRKAVNDDS